MKMGETAIDRLPNPSRTSPQGARSRRVWPLLAGAVVLCLAAPAGAQHSGVFGTTTTAGQTASVAPTQLVTETEILPGDQLPGDGLGSSSAVQGDVVVICTTNSDTVAINAGAAYIYRWSGGAFQLELKLAPTDLDESDRFGYSCALDGDVLAIGAPNHGALGDQVGTVYVYRYSAGVWGLEQKLFPGVPLVLGGFGTDVAVSGNVIAVGRWREVLGDLGRVHMFRHDGATWVEEASLTEPGLMRGDYYAYSLALDGKVLAVGSYMDDGFGSIYFYGYDGQDWTLTQKFFNPEPVFGDLFSKGISMDGHVLVTGANREDENGVNAGAAYVLRHNTSEWVLEQKLLASDGLPMDRFGTHVALRDNLIVVGARLDDHLDEIDAGSAYVFRRGPSGWVQTNKLIGADTNHGDWLGHTVATDGKTVLVNAPRHAHLPNLATGSTYLYRFPLLDTPHQAGAGPSVKLLSPGTPTVILYATLDMGGHHHARAHGLSSFGIEPQPWPTAWGAAPPAGVTVYALDEAGRILGAYLGGSRR